MNQFLNQTIENLYSSKKVYSPDGKEFELGGSVSKEEAYRLYDAVIKLNAKNTLETGFAYGASSVAIMEGLKANGGGKHIVIDPYQEDYHFIGTNMAKIYGLSEYLFFHHKFAEEVIPNLDHNLDFAFIDSSHVFDLTITEFVLIDKKLKTGGMIGFHDLWMPAIEKFIRFVLKNRKYEIYPYAPTQKRKTWKHHISSLLKSLPSAHKIFNEKIIDPFSARNFPNMILLKKVAEDKRHWEYFNDF